MATIIIPDLDGIPKPPPLAGRAILRTDFSRVEWDAYVAQGVEHALGQADGWRSPGESHETPAQSVAMAAYWSAVADAAERGDDQ